MTLVKATSDGDFVVEVSDKLDEFSVHMRDYTAAMIEEYLRRRTQEIREAAQTEMKEAFAVEREAWEDERVRMQQLAETADRLQHQVLRAAEVLENQSNRIAGIVAFRKWVASTAERRAQREKAAVAENHTRALLMCRAATRWRLFTVAAQERRRHEEELQASACEVEERKGEVEQLHKELARLQAEKNEIDAKLKAAFMKGMVALNREASQALQSGEKGSFDGEALEDLLTGSVSRHSSMQAGQSGDAAADQAPRRSAAFSDAGWRRSANSEAMLSAEMSGYGADADARSSLAGKAAGPFAEGVCPVHRTDEEGNFYHKCYAPESCYYGPRGATRREELEPFEIRVDPKGAPRRMDAGPPYARSSFASSTSLASHQHRKKMSNK